MKKPVSTVELAVGAVGMIKSLSIILAMVIIEWARAKQKLAETKQAVAETNLKIEKQKQAVINETRVKTAKDIVDGFLRDGK